ncbi:hypothetical protein BMF89_20420 [Arthrobacter sp. SRS-W-1-2016]|uniref:hypothetical protein n=1 Tax=Arthrobacter sp. SRS-W-1-2016 TaxID=1930254 RepID=UPI0009914C82|nr:hypothetical protein [Arthrobacter sp. SRS-W-1-2016]OOP59535.1 hypothetical protein BMF89_20420 [Arthrobacter sp. SRS-W-1-2016]
MAVKDRRTRTEYEHKANTLAEWINTARPSFSQAELLSALEDMNRGTTAVELSAPDRAFWNEYSGIDSSPASVAVASAANAAARIVLDASAFTAAEVAEHLGLTASTVRHYKAARKLYSYLVDGKLAFPAWQFNEAGDKPIPSLDAALGALPEDLHPQAVAGFFLTPQPDLVISGTPVSAKAWLEAGGSEEPVVELAEGLAAGY